MAYLPKHVLLISWPEAQRIMDHPKALLVHDDDNPNSYIISPEIWEQFKNSYYKIVDDLSASADSLEDRAELEKSINKDFCNDCGNSCSLDDANYCTSCNQCICDKCYIIYGRDIYCIACQKAHDLKFKNEIRNQLN